jgi:hypothetical protein
MGERGHSETGRQVLTILPGRHKQYLHVLLLIAAEAVDLDISMTAPADVGRHSDNLA